MLATRTHKIKIMRIGSMGEFITVMEFEFKSNFIDRLMGSTLRIAIKKMKNGDKIKILNKLGSSCAIYREIK